MHTADRACLHCTTVQIARACCWIVLLNRILLMLLGLMCHTQARPDGSA